MTEIKDFVPHSCVSGDICYRARRTWTELLLFAALLLAKTCDAAVVPVLTMGFIAGSLPPPRRGGTRCVNVERMRDHSGGVLCNEMGSKVVRKATAGDDYKDEEKMELAAEMVGAVTKATVGFAVDRAAATVSEEQGLPPPAGQQTGSQDQRLSAGAKRKALVGLLSSFVSFLKADSARPVTPAPAAAAGPEAWDVGARISADPQHRGRSSSSSSEGEDLSPSLSTSSPPPLMPSRSPVPPYGKETVAGVMVNGYWFPSLAAAAEAPAGKGFNFAEAAEVAAADAVYAKEARRRLKISRRCKVERKAIPKGLDFTSGAVLISCPSPRDASGDLGTPASGLQQQRPSIWRRWAMKVLEKTGLMDRAQQTVRDYVPRMPRETLLMIAGIAGGELAKREIAAQVEALEEPVREPAWALLNETYKNFEARAAELVESDWDFAALVSKQLAEWKRRGVGNSYQEALLKDVIQLQTMALLRPISLPAEEGSLMVQLNATYRSIEESIGRLLPQQTKEQLSLLEALLKKLDEKGIGELSFDEVYRALLLGAVPPALVTDAVRLLAAGRPTGEGGDGGGPAFLSDEGAGAATAAAQAYYGSGGDVTLAALAARLNDTQEISRVMTYTALAAETEVIENLREVLDGLQSNIRKSLEDIEAELKQPPPPSLVQGVASYVNNAARSAVTVAIEGFNNASKVFDASFEALAEPSRRTLLRSSELFPWQTWSQAWANITKGEDNLFPDAEHKRIGSAADALLADGTIPPLEDDNDDHRHHEQSGSGRRNIRGGGGGGTVAGKLRAVAGADAGGKSDNGSPALSRRRYNVRRWRPEPIAEPPEGGDEDDGGTPDGWDPGWTTRGRWKG